MIISRARDQYLLSQHHQYRIIISRRHQTYLPPLVTLLKFLDHLKLQGRPTHAVQTLILGEVVEILLLIAIPDYLVDLNQVERHEFRYLTFCVLESADVLMLIIGTPLFRLTFHYGAHFRANLQRHKVVHQDEHQSMRRL